MFVDGEVSSNGLRKFSRSATNIQGGSEETFVTGKRRLMSSAKSTAFDIIHMAPTTSDVTSRKRQAIQSTYDPIHGTGIHRTLPRRRRLGERIGASW